MSASGPAGPLVYGGSNGVVKLSKITSEKQLFRVQLRRGYLLFYVITKYFSLSVLKTSEF